jgi:hypothetical protein
VDLEENSRACGLNEETLSNALKLPIKAYTKIREEGTTLEDGVPAAVYLNVRSLRLNLGSNVHCVSHLELQLLRMGSVTFYPSREQANYMAILWEAGFMVSQNSRDTESRVLKAVDELARKFCAQWQNDNP